MLFIILQLTTLIAVSIILLSIFENKYIKTIFSILLSLFLALEISSILLTNTFIDFRFYTHFNLDSISDFAGLFIKYFIIGVVVFILIMLFIYKISTILSKSKMFNNYLLVILIVISFFILNIQNGIIYNIHNIYQITNAKNKSFNQALKDLNIDPAKYVTIEELYAKSGKNIIVISIESLEQGYLSKNFNNLTPNLTKLSKEWTYFSNMPAMPGASWTAGSLYTHQTGVPALFNVNLKEDNSNGYINEEGQGNNLFQYADKTKLVGLGNILSKAGYDYKYLMGNIEFAGVKNILNKYGYKTISEKNSIGKYKKKKYGLDDYDLFNEAKLQINNMIKTKKPFALFISTINSHFPNGLYDKRMEKYISKKDTNLEFTVASVDYLIGDFIKFLNEKKLLKNTAIYLFPDHLLMGKGGSVYEKLNLEKRKLYLITNVNKEKFHKKASDTIYQIDLPKIIIEGAEIKTNAKFLTDFIQPNNIIDFINKNIVKITSLNNASMIKDKYVDGIEINLIKNRLIIKLKGKQTKSIEFYIKPDAYAVYNLTFSKDMSLINYKKLYYKYLLKPYKEDIMFKNLQLSIVVDDNNISSIYFGNKQKIGIFKKGNPISISKDEIKSIIQSNKLQYSEDIEPYIKEIAASNIKLKNMIFDIKDSNYTLINAKVKKINNKLLVTAITDDPIIKLKKINTVSKYAILHCNIDSNNSTKFQIFYRNSDKISYKASKSFSLDVYKGNNIFNIKIPSKYIKNNLRIDIADKKGNYIINDCILYSNYTINKTLKSNLSSNYLSDSKRYIAHAGGGINGHLYTNSLEALNNSYKLGFKLFELDIQKTSDNFFVAVHDWKSWAKMVGYSGVLPPDKKTFKKFKIYKKFSPLDMDDINIWFKEHSDAILVTDKTNKPIEFSNKFIDKNRLMMELFTWKAIEEATKVNILSAMPSVNLIRAKDSIEKLEKFNIKHVVASGNFAKEYSHLINKIKNKNIKIYMYFENKPYKEIQAICCYRDYFYGIYANSWNFKSSPIDCSIFKCEF